MKRTLLATVGFFALATMLVGTTWAQSPNFHYANSSLDTGTACLDVSFKETGLGGAGFTSDVYTLSCSTINYTVGCVNKGSKLVQGVPKSGTTQGFSSGTFDIRNGQTTGFLALCPANVTLPNPGCTGSQQEVILAASYRGCTLSENDFLSSTSVGDQSSSSLFVVVR